MELFVVSMAIIGLSTTICAIDESIDWLESYRREAREDLGHHKNQNDPFFRVDTVNDFKPFMDRSVGRWVSLRRYLFGRNRTSGEYSTEFVIEHLEDDYDYRITWSGKTEGEMDVTLVGNQLKRSRSYFSEEETYQTMAKIDPDAVVFYTAYDGTRYREEIRFLDDNTRLRQTVGWNQETNDIELVGQYFEERVI